MPARNEVARIGPLIRTLRERVPQAAILVIDDESSDGTHRVAAAAGAFVARLPFNLGYGGALQTGYKFAMAHDFDFVVQMDADGQHRPADVPVLLERVTSGSCDLAIGSRFAQRAGGAAANSEPQYEMQAIRSVGRRMLCFFARLGGLQISDPTSGFQALNRRSLQLFTSSWYPTDYPDVDVLLLAHRSGLRVEEEPVSMAPSPRPSMLHSGWMPVYYAYRMLLSLWAVSTAPRSEAIEAAPRIPDLGAADDASGDPLSAISGSVVSGSAISNSTTDEEK
jgi:glycosyltransferase involved in cell wall biosynthesis